MSYFVVLYLAASCSFPIGMSGNGVDVVGESKCRVTPVVRSFVRSILVTRGEHCYVLVVGLVVLIVSEYWERRVRHVTHVPYINRKDSSQDVITSNRVGYANDLLCRSNDQRVNFDEVPAWMNVKLWWSVSTIK